MTISWILYSLIRWQPVPACEPVVTISSASCSGISPMLEVYYLWQPPQFVTLENRL